MSPTTGSSGGGRSTSLSFQRLESLSSLLLLLLSSSLCGLGGRSLQRDTRFLLRLGFVCPSRSLDLERERLRLRPPSLSVSRPPSLCKGSADLRKTEVQFLLPVRAASFPGRYPLLGQNPFLNYPLSELFPQKLGMSISSSFMAAAATCSSSLSVWHGGIWRRGKNLWQYIHNLMKFTNCSSSWNVLFLPLLIFPLTKRL